MNNTIILDFNSNNINDILNIEKTSLFSNWNKQMFLDVLLNKNQYFKIILYDNKIVGYIIYSIILDEAEILNVVVDKNFRGLSFGKQLLEYAISDMKNKKVTKIFLEVASKNNIAINLYKKFNFVQYNIRKNYYKTDDAILMNKNI